MTSAPENCQVHDSPHAARGRCEAAALEWRHVPPGASAAGIAECAWLPGRWPEPHEGIVGIARLDDDLLDLTDRALARRRMMVVTAKAFQDALLVGDPAPIVKRMYERFGARDGVAGQGPRAGDLVIEVTALHRDDPERIRTGFGILLTHRDEWWTTAAEWDAAIAQERSWHDEHYPGEPFDADATLGRRSVDHAWYVQYGPAPGDVCRWTNCSFVVLPTSMDDLAALRPAIGTPTADGGVSLDRDDVLGALADSGIRLRGLEAT